VAGRIPSGCMMTVLSCEARGQHGRCGCRPTSQSLWKSIVIYGRHSSGSIRLFAVGTKGNVQCGKGSYVPKLGGTLARAAWSRHAGRWVSCCRRQHAVVLTRAYMSRSRPGRDLGRSLYTGFWADASFTACCPLGLLSSGLVVLWACCPLERTALPCIVNCALRRKCRQP
jgi:hypothetical protein